MAGKNAVYDWDAVAANNLDIASISLAENVTKPSDVNNFERAHLAQVKTFALDLGAANTVAGTANAPTITLASNITALVDGLRFVFSASAVNTTAVTATVKNSAGTTLGTPNIKKWVAGVATDLSAGDIPGASAIIEVFYDLAAAALFIASTSVAAATTTSSGIVELATQTEASTLADTTRAITSDGLFFLGGYTTTATAAGTTTLTVTSTYGQYFTGTTTQTVVLPVASTLVLGRSYRIVNNSTGAVTVQSSGANTIKVMGGTGITLAPGAPGTELIVTCILTSGTGTASWDYEYRTPTTDWVTYTPTFTGFGTPTNISMWSRRVGDTLYVQGYFTTGTCTAVEARMTIGYNGTNANVTSSTSKVPALRGAGQVFQGQALAAQLTALVESAVGYFTFGWQTGAAFGLAKANASNPFFSAVQYSIQAEVPIQGW